MASDFDKDTDIAPPEVPADAAVVPEAGAEIGYYKQLRRVPKKRERTDD